MNLRSWVVPKRGNLRGRVGVVTTTTPRLRAIVQFGPEGPWRSLLFTSLRPATDDEIERKARGLLRCDA